MKSKTGVLGMTLASLPFWLKIKKNMIIYKWKIKEISLKGIGDLL
ncbi:hypothetical protein [Bacillus sp. 123MFChir2]|nr:hypothetical protein [Bacillus sp. 123MFChir2]